jgi:N-alpha-acetyl-L-2,4-diaminobutyrate deacetylase
MHVVADLDQRQKMLGAMLAWNTDFAFLYTDIAGTGLLPVEAENQGKIVVTTELGGGEAIPAHVHRIAYQGLRNVLMHLGVLAGRSVSREELNQKPAIITAALDATNYLLAPKSGIFEIGVELGDSVVAGQPIGYIHDLESPQNEPEVIVASKTGYLVCMRAPCLTQQGDCVAVIAQEVERSRLSDPVVDLS